MARTPTTKTAPAEMPEILPAVADNIERGQELVAQQSQAAAALARQLGYELPGGSVDPDLIQRDVAANMRRSVDAVLEMGKGLAVLKAACGHGNFIARLEVLGIDRHVAKRLVATANKFSNGPTSAHLLKAAGSQSKVFELLVLDDDQVSELAESGRTGALTIDEIDRMGVRELRAALRKEKQDRQRTQQVADELSSEVVQLKAAGKVVADTDWPEALAPISEQVAAAGRKLATALSEMESCRITLFSQAGALADDKRPAFEAALRHVAEVYAQALERAERGVERERLTFDKTLGAFAE